MDILQLHRKEPYPPSSGVDKRVWKTAERLSDFGDVSLAVPWDETVGVPHVNPVDVSTPWLDQKVFRIYAWTAIFLLDATTRRNPVDRLITNAVLSSIADSGVEPDLVVCECLQMGNAAREIARKHNAPLLVNHHNSEFRIVQQFLDDRGVPDAVADRLVANFRDYERYTVNRADGVVFQSSENVTDFDLSGPGVYHVIPNGTDVEEIRTSDPENVPVEDLGIDPSKPTAIFVGAFDYEPNKKAADAIAETIAPACPDVEFFVVGRSPPAYDQSNVFTPGFVEDLGSFLQYADVALCPLTMGSGTKLKMLDYLAAGLPIVTTPTGTQGLELDNGVHVLQVDRPEAFPEAIRTVLESEEQRKNLEENALDIADQYSWETLLAGYEEIVWNLTDESTVTPEA